MNDYLPAEDLQDFELILLSEQSLSIDQQRQLTQEIRRQEAVILRQFGSLERAHGQIDQQRREYQEAIEIIHRLQGVGTFSTEGYDQRAA